MASVINNTEAESWVCLVKSNSGSVGSLNLGSWCKFESWKTNPVQLLEVSLCSQSVANNVVLSAIEEDLQIWKVGLGQKPSVVWSVAGTNIDEEIVINAADTVLVGDVGVNTESSLGIGGVKVIIVREVRWEIVNLEVVDIDVAIQFLDVIGDLVEEVGGSGEFSLEDSVLGLSGQQVNGVSLVGVQKTLGETVVTETGKLVVWVSPTISNSNTFQD